MTDAEVPRRVESERAPLEDAHCPVCGAQAVYRVGADSTDYACGSGRCGAAFDREAAIADRALALVNEHERIEREVENPVGQVIEKRWVGLGVDVERRVSDGGES